jgi:hypothetical protein
MRGARSAAVMALAALAASLLVPIVAADEPVAHAAAQEPDQTFDCQWNTHQQEGAVLPDGFYLSPGIQISVHMGDPFVLRIPCKALGDSSWVLPEGKTAVETPTGKISVEGNDLTIVPRIDARGQSLVYLRAKNGALIYDYGGSSLGKSVKIVVNIVPYKVYAIGDSWTAAFGYYGDGSSMPVTDLLLCKPGTGKLNDRCSSNGYWNGFDGQTAGLRFASDYGYGNNISWAAMAAHQILAKTGGDYVNYAVSGAEPANFQDGGVLRDLVDRTVNADPDILFVTLGGNPMLGDVLETLDECQAERKLGVSELRNCALRLMKNKYHVQDRLTSVYKALLAAKHSQIVISSYTDYVIPYYPRNSYTFAEWGTFGSALNSVVARTVAVLQESLPPRDASRLHLVMPTTVPLGAHRESGPVECRRDGQMWRVDGSSRLADILQRDLALGSNKYKFCGVGAEYKDGSSWKPAGADPWFNSQDLGTHLTRSGNAQLAAAAMKLVDDEKMLPQPLKKRVRVEPIPVPQELEHAPTTPPTSATTAPTAPPDATTTSSPPDTASPDTAPPDTTPGTVAPETTPTTAPPETAPATAPPTAATTPPTAAPEAAPPATAPSATEPPTTAPPVPAPTVDPNRCEVTIVNRTNAPVRITEAHDGKGDHWAPQSPVGVKLDPGETFTFATQDPPPGGCRIDAKAKVDRPGTNDATATIVTSLKGDSVEAKCTPSAPPLSCVSPQPAAVANHVVTVSYELKDSAG